MSRNYSKFLGVICMMVLGATHAYPQSLDSLTTSDLAAFRTILAEKERKAFDKLPTPAAKREWVKIYWKRHDPTPTTEKNERLEEFWRRLQYARKWFSAPDPVAKPVPGCGQKRFKGQG
ncbi:MAG: GWxTD domain-containing protein, partial [Calditrichaeota bacterium]